MLTLKTVFDQFSKKKIFDSSISIIEKSFHDFADIQLKYHQAMDTLQKDIGETSVTEEDEEETYEDTGTDVYGSNVREIMMDPDMDWAEKTAEVQLDIENVLSRHPDIIEVSDFKFTQKGRTMVVEFTVSSIYGADFNEEVVINGTNS